MSPETADHVFRLQKTIPGAAAKPKAASTKEETKVESPPKQQ